MYFSAATEANVNFYLNMDNFFFLNFDRFSGDWVVEIASDPQITPTTAKATHANIQ